ncbi:MAG: hypothetical protein R6X20_12990 [Phycisphaerae bacterium]
MHRFALPLMLLAAAVALPEVAPAQTEEFELPPVRLKPDRPSKTKPIPPTPDDRETDPSEKEVEEPEKAPPVKEAEEDEKKPPAAPDTEKAKPPEAVPLKPETHEDGEPPTPADLPLPETPAEPSETSPATIALPDREAPPEAPTPPDMPATVGREPRPAEARPRPTEIQAEAVEAQVTPTVEPRLAGLGEVGLVEAVATARKQYERTLQTLKAYYTDRGHNAKIEWVESELRGFSATPKPRYLLAAEIAGPELRPSRTIEAADQLYQEGLHFKNYPAFPPGKKEYLKVALEKFRTVIEKYPQSDKIDDAAFRMGEIYGGWYFQDYARAVMSYERCWQWNPETQHPARFNAAKIFEEKLKNRAKAVELYNEVIAHTENEELAKQAQERIRALTGR